MLTFIQSCLLSESDLVSFVTRHAVWFGRMSSPVGRNAFHCCHRFDVLLDKLLYVTPVLYMISVLRKLTVNLCT